MKRKLILACLLALAFNVKAQTLWQLRNRPIKWVLNEYTSFDTTHISYLRTDSLKSLGGTTIKILSNVNLDKNATDSPTFSWTDKDNKTLVITKLDAGAATLTNNEGAINLLPSNDVDDYISFSTASNVVQISNIGGANGSDDFKIVTDDGDLVLAPADALDLMPSGDVNDYISITTVSNVPQISNVGGANGADDFKIITDDGDLYIAPADALDIVTSGDTDDYITISTSSHLPQISTTGGADGANALKILTDDGHILIQPADDLELSPTGGDITSTSATASKPTLSMENTADDATGPIVNLVSNRANPADTDVSGTINFKADDAGGNPETVVAIVGSMEEVAEGDEAGRLKISVMHDDGSPALDNMLDIVGDNGTPGQGYITINEDGKDVDFTIEASGVANALIVTGSSGDVSFGTKIVPDASGGADIGSTSLEWGNVYVADDKKVYFGSGQDFSIEYDEDGNDIAQFAGTDIGFNDKYALALQNIPDLVVGAEKTAYWFDGVDDVVTVADVANLDLDDNVCSMITIFKWNESVTDNFDGLAFKVDGYGFYFDTGTANLFFRINQGGNVNSPAAVISQDVETIAAGVYDGSAVHIYKNGEEQGTATATTGNLIPNANDLAFGNHTAAGNRFFNGSISGVSLFNLALTATEVKALSSGSPIPYKYLGASQTEFMTTAEDRTFTAGTSDWTNAAAGDAYASYDETTDLSLTADAVGDYCYITFTNIGTVLEQGKRYRLTYDYSETVAGFEFKLEGAATQTLGDAVDGTSQTIEFTANELFATTDEFRIMAKTAATAEGDFDNLSIIQIGCVGQWEPDGITNGLWLDKSGNELNGTVTGALITNAKKGLILENVIAEDTDGGRESAIWLLGRQSGKERTTLAKIEASHDGAADDEKGQIKWYVNDTNDANAPTLGMTLDSGGALTVVGGITAGGDLTFTSATASKPVMILENTADDATAPSIYLEKDRATAGGAADQDAAGSLYFQAGDDGGTQRNAVSFLGTLEESATADAAGRLQVKIFHDDGSPAADNFLDMSGDNGTPGQGFIELNADNKDVDIILNADAEALVLEGSSGNLTLKDAAADATFTIAEYHDTEATTALLVMRKAEGTLDTPTASPLDDNAVLGTISFRGYDTDQYIEGARIQAIVNGTPADDQMPTDIEFYTNTGAATATLRMTLDEAGDLTLTNATTSKPVFTIKNTTDDATAGTIELSSDRATPTDGDVAGTIIMEASDGGGTQTDLVTFVGSMVEVDDAEEIGKLVINVFDESDGTGALESFVAMSGGNSVGGVQALYEINAGQKDVDFEINASGASAFTVTGATGAVDVVSNFTAGSVSSDAGLTALAGNISATQATGTALSVVLEADASEDNADTWQLLIADGDEFAIQAYAGGSYADALTIVGSTLAADFPGALTAGSFVSDGLITAQGAFTSPGIDDNADATAITIDMTTEKVNFSAAADVATALTAGTVTSDATVKATTMIGHVAQQTITLPGAATTFVVTSNVVQVTGDGGGNTIATITGAEVGIYVFIFVDALVTITNDDAHGADSIDLDGAGDFGSNDDYTLTLVYDGTSWYQVAETTN